MTTIELHVGGMTCGGCESSVGKALERIDGVADVSADHRSGTVTVTVEKDIDRSVLASAVEDAGYDVLPEGRQGLPMA